MSGTLDRRAFKIKQRIAELRRDWSERFNKSIEINPTIGNV